MTIHWDVKCQLRYWVYFLLVFTVLMVEPAFAQVGGKEIDFDATFWFKAVVTALISVLIWVAKGSDGRLKEVENRTKEFNVISAERAVTVKNIEDRLLLVEHEHKQLATMIALQREMMLTKYHDKEETEKHREKVEESLRSIALRLDTMNRPSHRSQDDETRYRSKDK